MERQDTVCMGVEALGSYIQELIDRQGITALTVTRAADVSPNYVWRLKTNGVKEPSARIVGALVRASGGSMEHAVGLLLDDSATEEDGKALAAAHLATRPDGAEATPDPMSILTNEKALLQTVDQAESAEIRALFRMMMDTLLDVALQRRREHGVHNDADQPDTPPAPQGS